MQKITINAIAYRYKSSDNVYYYNEMFVRAEDAKKRIKELQQIESLDIEQYFVTKKILYF